MLYGLIDGEAAHLSSLISPSLPIYNPSSRLLAPLLIFCHMSTISDMSQISSSSTFQTLFNAALLDYKDKTGNALTDHPIAMQLETCESVNSITAILQEQAQSFHEFRENDVKLMKALNSSVDVLCSPSISSALNGAIGVVVSLKAFIVIACSRWPFYSQSRLRQQY